MSSIEEILLGEGYTDEEKRIRDQQLNKAKQNDTTPDSKSGTVDFRRRLAIARQAAAGRHEKLADEYKSKAFDAKQKAKETATKKPYSSEVSNSALASRIHKIRAKVEDRKAQKFQIKNANNKYAQDTGVDPAHHESAFMDIDFK